MMLPVHLSDGMCIKPACESTTHRPGVGPCAFLVRVLLSPSSSPHGDNYPPLGRREGSHTESLHLAEITVQEGSGGMGK